MYQTCYFLHIQFCLHLYTIHLQILFRHLALLQQQVYMDFPQILQKNLTYLLISTNPKFGQNRILKTYNMFHHRIHMFHRTNKNQHNQHPKNLPLLPNTMHNHFYIILTIQDFLIRILTTMLVNQLHQNMGHFHFELRGRVAIIQFQILPIRLRQNSVQLMPFLQI